MESADLFRHIDAHAVLRISSAYMSLWFILLFFYFKNSRLKERESCCLVHIFDLLLAEILLLPEARTKLIVV